MNHVYLYVFDYIYTYIHVHAYMYIIFLYIGAVLAGCANRQLNTWPLLSCVRATRKANIFGAQKHGYLGAHARDWAHDPSPQVSSWCCVFADEDVRSIFRQVEWEGIVDILNWNCVSARSHDPTQKFSSRTLLVCPNINRINVNCIHVNCIQIKYESNPYLSVTLPSRYYVLLQ